MLLEAKSNPKNHWLLQNSRVWDAVTTKHAAAGELSQVIEAISSEKLAWLCSFLCGAKNVTAYRSIPLCISQRSWPKPPCLPTCILDTASLSKDGHLLPLCAAPAPNTHSPALSPPWERVRLLPISCTQPCPDQPGLSQWQEGSRGRQWMGPQRAAATTCCGQHLLTIMECHTLNLALLDHH